MAANRFLFAIGVIATIVVLVKAAALPAPDADPEAKPEPFMGGMGLYSMLYPLLMSSMYGYGMYGLGGLGMMGMYGMGGLGFGLLW
ncbi:hypothetical protein SK128_018977 [Halocaridina rubra]|uniref:Uncharacterized protein n=1 Tax=Halocaridina rubra TaxID=373956 RepID=A0AAN8XAV7_HALRR